VLVEPSPQAIVALWVSVEPASVNEKPRLTVLPPRQDTPLLGSVTLRAPTAGSAFETVTEVEAVLPARLSLSVACTLTVEEAGPSRKVQSKLLAAAVLV
jgi:hypothetical protein